MSTQVNFTIASQMPLLSQERNVPKIQTPCTCTRCRKTNSAVPTAGWHRYTVNGIIIAGDSVEKHLVLILEQMWSVC